MRKALLSIGVTTMLFGAFPAFADIIYSQATSSEQIGSVTNQVYNLGNGIDAPYGIEQIGVAWSTQGAAHQMQVQIECRQFSDYSGAQCPEWNDTTFQTESVTVPSATTTRVLQVTTGSTQPMITSRYYRVRFIRTGGATHGIQLAGRTIPTTLPYLVLIGPDTEGTDFTSSFISAINNPSQGEVTSSVNVQFDYDYWNTGFEGFDKAGIHLNNFTTGQTVSVSESEINAIGSGSFTRGVILTASSTYSYRPYLRSSTSGERVYGSTIIFYTLENTGGQSFIPDTDNATSTLETLFGSVFGILNLFAQRFPFNWFFETAAILEQLGDQEAADQAAVTLDFSGISSTTAIIMPEPIEVFSSSTVQHFLPEGMLDTMKLLISAALYLGLATNIFFSVKNIYA